MPVMVSVLITGCSSGFGELAARSFAAAGHDVIATMRTPSRGEDLLADAAAAGWSLRVVALDVTDQASIHAAKTEVGVPDVLVNNAGVELVAPVTGASDEEMLWQFEANVFGVARMLRTFVPDMRDRGAGVVVNVGSIAGLVGRPFAGFYAATKHALEGLSEALRFEVGRRGVRVHLIQPGQFPTALGGNTRHAEAFAPGSEDWELNERLSIAIKGLVPESTSGGADAQTVADVIVRVALDPEAPFRTLVGGDAEMIAAVKAHGTFEDFEQTMRTTLDFWE
ncbi:MAG: SDR family oxidoreductase [Actinomycetota bacterium]